VVDRDEAALARRAQAGDVAAFGSLAEIHAKPVYRLAYRFCWNADDADDIAQETFVRAFEYLRSFRQGSDFGPWLCRVAVNVCLAYRERQQRAQRGASLVATEADGEDGEGWADRIGISSRVQEEIGRLPGRQQAAIVLFELEGLSVEETARAMGCSAGTVKRHLHRARATLRGRLLDLVEDTADVSGGVEVEVQDSSADDGPAGGSATTG
jgi:RNA polymerase sigma-70 factor (ECF subfamily)